MKRVGAQVLKDSLNSLFSLSDYKSLVPNFASGIFNAAKDFHIGIEKALCEILPLPKWL